MDSVRGVATSAGPIPAERGDAGDRPQRPRHPDHARPARRADDAQAVSDGRAHRAAAGDRQPRQVRPGAARGTSSARPTTSWWPAGPTTCSRFCMCAGGYIIPSVSEAGYFCTNGMSLSGRDSPFANSGLVITVPVERFPGHGPAGRRSLAAGIRTQGLRAGPGQAATTSVPFKMPATIWTIGPRKGAGVQLSPRSGAGPHRGTGAADHRRACGTDCRFSTTAGMAST